MHSEYADDGSLGAQFVGINGLRWVLHDPTKLPDKLAQGDGSASVHV